MQHLITNTYEHQLAYHYHNIDMRGLLIDTDKKEHARQVVEDEIKDRCDYLTNTWGFVVYVGSANAPKDRLIKKDSLNLNANSGPNTVLLRLKSLGFDVPKIRKKDAETDSYEYKDSANKLALYKILSDPNRWPSPTSGEGIKKLVECKEAITFKTRYLNAPLYKNTYYSSYNSAGTTSGRRNSRKNIFGFGGNSQNFPSRGRLSHLWKECIISRPGRIFLFVDQKSAEDWPVQALSENHTALEQMINGVNRHYIFASKIFGINIDDLKAMRSNKKGLYTQQQQDDAEMKYYMGKKGRHSNNYGMQPTRMSESLATEGYTVPVDSCKNILQIVDGLDPNVKRIFHKYIQEQLAQPEHKLRTPLGRERVFLGLRSGDKNYSILNEAYAWIPQSVIGDNTGLAVCELEKCHPYILQDGHDSLCQELEDEEHELRTVFKNTKNAFHRTITFHNGITVEVPIEAQLGYDWYNKVPLEDYTEECLMDVYNKIKREKTKTCGRSWMATTV